MSDADNLLNVLPSTSVLAVVLSVLESDVVEDTIVDSDGVTENSAVTSGSVLAQVDKEGGNVFSFVRDVVLSADFRSVKDKVEVRNVSGVASMGNVTL